VRDTVLRGNLYPFRVSAAVTIAALPVAAVVLWVLLRSSRVGERLVAHPTGERWHDASTPTFGGVGIALGLFAGVGLAVAVGAVDLTGELLGILAGCAILFVAGLIDDIRHLSPVAKLAAQFAAAGVAVAAGLRVELIGNDVIATVVAIVWLVGITNAFNLLDNMDGLAATLAAVACGYFAVDAATAHENDVVLVLALSLGFACLGFLPFNLRPGQRAAVFMGDSGSQVLGFMLAALGLAASWTTAGTTVATMLLPLLVLAVPILDTTLVTVMRLREKRPVTEGGRDHTSHRLVYYGLSEGKAVALLAMIALALGATSIAYNVLDNERLTMVGVLLTFVLLVQFGGFLSDVGERTRRGQPGDTSFRHALTFEPRRLVEVLVDFVLVCGSFLAAYLLVVGGKGSELQRGTFLAALPVVLGVRYVSFIAFRIYRRVWRYATSRDALAIVAAVLVSEVVAFGIVEATRSLGPFPARVFLVDAVLCIGLVTASRLGLKALPALRAARDRDRERVLVVGAGGHGRGVARELRESGALVVGFVDDNRALRRRRIAGVTVLGAVDEIPTLLVTARPDKVLVTIPDASPDRLALVVEACEAAGVPCRFVHRRTETAAPLVEVTAK
jgi:UDP-GlcNAc:undecaprenyl-phosphate/decaprenyl-phosphate GlcNAc-1-phosphate transferase